MNHYQTNLYKNPDKSIGCWHPVLVLCCLQYEQVIKMKICIKLNLLWNHSWMYDSEKTNKGFKHSIFLEKLLMISALMLMGVKPYARQCSSIWELYTTLQSDCGDAHADLELNCLYMSIYKYCLMQNQGWLAAAAT